jgi:hypothetical protein
VKLCRFTALGLATAAYLATLGAAAQERDIAAADRSIHRFQLSLWSTVQTSAPSSSIHGLRLNLPYGQNRSVHGVDVGVANYVTEDFNGAEFGVGGYAKGDLRGVQSNLILSIAGGSAWGYQEGIYTYARVLPGVHTGVVTRVEKAAYGARLGAVNLSEAYMEGADFGIVNYARRANGLQLGLVNVTRQLRGVQIGLVNVANNGILPAMPLFNAAL